MQRLPESAARRSALPNHPEVSPGNSLDALDCTCGAHSQHRTLRARWDNPTASLRQTAKDLGMNYWTCAKLWERCRKRRDFSRLCPVCFQPKRVGLQCHGCGTELDSISSVEIDFDSQYPVHRIQPLGGLGSMTSYGLVSRRMKLNNTGAILKQRAEHDSPSPFQAAKKQMLQWLKGFTPSEDITDAAYRLLSREFSEFENRYPNVRINPQIRTQLLNNAEQRLALAYPQVSVQTSTPDESDEVP